MLIKPLSTPLNKTPSTPLNKPPSKTLSKPTSEPRTMRAQHRWLAMAMVCVAAGLLFAARAAVSQQGVQPSERSLSGIITDDSHEPIRGAVIELRNSETRQVVTYISNADGRYNFKRLDGNADYEVWVLFRSRPSATRSISKFDSHMAKVINFTVRTY